MRQVFTLVIVTVAVVGLSVASLSAADDPAKGGEQPKAAAEAKPALKSPPKPIVEQAVKADLFRYSRTCKGGAHTNGAWGGGSLVTLAVASYGGDASADKRLLEQLRLMLRGDNSISANGGYPAQHERHFTGACALAKLTPRVWDQLTEAERKKVDLAMKAALVASAYTTSDKSYAGGRKVTALDGDENLNRGWNPNFQEGMLGAMIVGAVYFGPAEAQKMLDEYAHEPFAAELKEAGLSNTWETFAWKAAHADSKAPTAKEIEDNVHGYRYESHDLSDPMELYYLLTTRTYGKTVNAGLNGGKGIRGAGCIAKGAANLPNVGQPGMLMEFDSNDAKGQRSSVGYAYDGFRPNLTNHIVLVAGGRWQKGEKADKCLELMNVGITDLFYKLQNGYISYSKGKGSAETFDLSERGWDFALTRSLWQDVVKPYHGK